MNTNMYIKNPGKEIDDLINSLETDQQFVKKYITDKLTLYRTTKSGIETLFGPQSSAASGIDEVINYYENFNPYIEIQKLRALLPNVHPTVTNMGTDNKLLEIRHILDNDNLTANDKLIEMDKLFVESFGLYQGMGYDAYAKRISKQYWGNGECKVTSTKLMDDVFAYIDKKKKINYDTNGINSLIDTK